MIYLYNVMLVKLVVAVRALLYNVFFITVSNGLPYKYTAYHITWRGYN